MFSIILLFLPFLCTSNIFLCLAMATLPNLQELLKDAVSVYISIFLFTHLVFIFHIIALLHLKAHSFPWIPIIHEEEGGEF